MGNLRDLKVLIRGAGEMASGVAHVLRTSGLKVAMTEVDAPLAIRRSVSFCECVWEGSCMVEGVTAKEVEKWEDFDAVIDRGEVPVIVDPELRSLGGWKPDVLIDATLAKRSMGLKSELAPLVIALGSGFLAPEDADIVVETNRGHDLGRLIRQGAAAPNTGVPGMIAGFSHERVVYAPCRGTLKSLKSIGDLVEAGEPIAVLGDATIASPLKGVLRGLMRDGARVREGLKIADVDPRGEVDYCRTISEKARGLGTNVLWAIVSTVNSPNEAPDG